MIKTTKSKDLDCICREEHASLLSNVITECMVKNNMTLENLDEAREIVKEAYRKNATIKGNTTRSI